MAKLIIFVALLAVHYAHGITEDLRTSVNSGLYLNTATVTKGELECQLETNNGEIYKFAPGDKIIPDATEMRVYSLDRSSCSVGIHPVQKTDNGVWKITAVNAAAAEEYIFNVYLKRNAGVIPADSAVVKEGAFVHGMMAAPKSAFDNMKNCVITTPQKVSFDVNADVVDGVKPVGECGARIVGKPEFNGLWKFEVITNDFLVYTATMRVEVRPAKSDDIALPQFTPATRELELTLGLPGKIAAGPSEAKFCQMRNAEFTMLPAINGPCNYQIPVVTPRHAGYWFMYYALPGNLNLTVSYLQIFTREQRGISGNASYLDIGEIKLACSAHYSYSRSLSFCRFTKPDGTVLNAAPGATDRKYSAFEADETTGDRGKDIYCGLTIHEPEGTDYGPWRCEVASKTSSNDVIGTVIHVEAKPTKPGSYNTRLVRIHPTEVVVKQGDRYSIKCVADEVLNYCWFRSPNGTAYSISASKSEQLPANTLAYKGAGLAMGECGAEIESAEFSDDGEWSCHLGVANGKEESQIFPVKVAENYVIARKEKMMPYDGVQLSCGIFRQEQDRAIHYCRWIRPDGYGIYNSEGDRYRTTSSKSECELVIEVFKPEDEGKWICVAGVMGSHVEEMQAEVIMESQPRYMSGIILGFTVAGCVMVTMSVVALIITQVCKRRNQLISQQAPVYEADPNPSPKSLNPSFATKEFQY